MYIFDFFKRTLKRANVPTYIYLCLNVFLIGAIIYFLLEQTLIYPMCVLIAIIIYFFSLCLALTPLGEWVLRVICCAKKTKPGLFKKKQKDYLAELQPLFDEVYKEARAKNPELGNVNIEFFMNVNDETINAFATGRRTICVNKGIYDLVKKGEENRVYVKAILAHEFGHIANKDTDLLLVVAVGNLFVTAIISFFRIILGFFFFMFGVFDRDIRLWYLIYRGVRYILIDLPLWLWTFIGAWLCMKSSREHEYDADEYAFKLGYGQDLAIILDKLKDEKGETGFFATLLATHPDTEDRIARLEELEKGFVFPPNPEPKSAPPVDNPKLWDDDPFSDKPKTVPLKDESKPAPPKDEPKSALPVDDSKLWDDDPFSDKPKPVPPKDKPKPVPPKDEPKPVPPKDEPKTGPIRINIRRELLEESTGDDF